MRNNYDSTLNPTETIIDKMALLNILFDEPIDEDTLFYFTFRSESDSLLDELLDKLQTSPLVEERKKYYAGKIAMVDKYGYFTTADDAQYFKLSNLTPQDIHRINWVMSFWEELQPLPQGNGIYTKIDERWISLDNIINTLTKS